jgi:hypothetical protein
MLVRVEIVIESCTSLKLRAEGRRSDGEISGSQESNESLSLVASSRGLGEVIVNGKELYSKLQTGDFPDFEANFKAVKAMC